METTSLAPNRDIERWFDSLTPVTRRNYQMSLKEVIGNDISAFIEHSRIDSDWATSFLLDWILQKRKQAKVSPQTIRTYIAAVKSLLLWSNINLNFYQIRKALPKNNKSKKDAPKTSDIQKLFDISDTRGKFVITAMSSGGFRVGAWEYFQVCDLTIRPEGIGELVVYRGEPEEYRGFISSECLKYWNFYLDERKRSGEIISDSSPLLRTIFDARDRHRDYSKGEIVRASVLSVQEWFFDKWREAGLKTRNFKQVHGFRAFFKTQLGNTEMKDEDVERLSGRKANGVIFAYNKKDMNDLVKPYLRFQQALLIGQDEILKHQLETTAKENDSMKVELSNKNRFLEGQVSSLQSDMEELKRQNKLAVELMIKVMEKHGDDSMMSAYSELKEKS